MNIENQPPHGSRRLSFEDYLQFGLKTCLAITLSLTVSEQFEHLIYLGAAAGNLFGRRVLVSEEQRRPLGQDISEAGLLLASSLVANTMLLSELDITQKIVAGLCLFAVDALVLYLGQRQFSHI